MFFFVFYKYKPLGVTSGTFDTPCRTQLSMDPGSSLEANTALGFAAIVLVSQPSLSYSSSKTLPI